MKEIKKELDSKKKRIIIISSAILCVSLIALCILFAILNNSGPASGTVELEGVYSISIDGIGGSSYTFRADGSGVRSYFAEDVENTEEFSYSIADKTISFVWKDSGKTDSHSFEIGKMGEVDVIFINEVTYYKK